MVRHADDYTNEHGAAMTSRRLRLAPVSPADAGELLLLFQDAAVRRFLLDDTLVSATWVDDEIRTSTTRFASGSAGLWSIRRRDDRLMVGIAGFREFFDPPQLQLLYALLPAYWHQGLATEAAERICRHAFETLGFAAVNAATDVPNVASISVLERLGATRVRTSAAGPAGTVFFVITRETWLARAGEAYG